MMVSYSERSHIPAGIGCTEFVTSSTSEVHVGEKDVLQSWSGRGYRLQWLFCGGEELGRRDSLDPGTREQTECEGKNWHTRASSLHLISCQPTSQLEMTMVPRKQEDSPERIRGGGCCDWGPAGKSKHADDHPGLQIGQERPVTAQPASGKQPNSGKPDPATSLPKQQQKARSDTVPGPSNSTQAPPKPTKPTKAAKPPKVPKVPKAPKPLKPSKVPKPTKASSTPTPATSTPTPGPSNPRKAPLKPAQGPSNSPQVPVEPSHPIFPNLPNRLPERR